VPRATARCWAARYLSRADALFAPRLVSRNSLRICSPILLSAARVTPSGRAIFANEKPINSGEKILAKTAKRLAVRSGSPGAIILRRNSPRACAAVSRVSGCKSSPSIWRTILSTPAPRSLEHRSR
jgi:hypothetical protein